MLQRSTAPGLVRGCQQKQSGNLLLVEEGKVSGYGALLWMLQKFMLTAWFSNFDFCQCKGDAEYPWGGTFKQKRMNIWQVWKMFMLPYIVQYDNNDNDNNNSCNNN